MFLQILIHSILVILLYTSFIFYMSSKFEQVNIIEQEIKYYQQESFKPIEYNKTVNALVLFSYKSKHLNTDLLTKYLTSNLKSNGGILDKIIFGIQTSHLETKFKNLIKLYPNEIFIKGLNSLILGKYSLIDDNDYVFKIDEHIVFVSNNTFKYMLDEYSNENDEILSGNIISDSKVFEQHLMTGAIKPFYLSIYNNWVIYDQKDHVILDKCKIESNLKVCFSLAHENLFHNLKTNNLKKYNFGRWKSKNNSFKFVLLKGSQLKNLNFIKNSDIYVLSIGQAIVSFLNDFNKEKIYFKKYLNLAKEYFD